MMTLVPQIKNVIYCCCLFAYSFLVRAQEQVPFAQIQNKHINGDAILIGNSILGKNVSKKHDDFGLLNDQIRMKYIDVDNTSSTFSSSTADISIPYQGAKIVSASLYWSATYPFEKGSKREGPTEITYKGNDKRSGEINEVLFKTPNSEYTTVNGTIIFDGFENESFTESAPYVCYADVTSLMDNNAINGTYTVANVTATQGFMSGGSAAGWMLFVVYESDEATPKSISSFHGFSYLNDSEQTIEFNNFKTVAKGNVDASIFTATLEGDGKLYRDQCALYNTKTETFSILRSNQRPAKNFFNSKITRNDKVVTSRNPASLNTLGFDLVELKVPKGLITNDQTETVLKLSTRADRYYVFFTAFKVEIDEAFYLNKEAIVSSKIEFDSDIIKTSKRADLSDLVEAQKEEEVTLERIRKELKQVTLSIPGMDPSYYLITNVFSKPKNAAKWKDFLKSKGHSPDSFVNPKNNWYYVYIAKSSDLKEVYKTYKKLAIHNYFNEIWVFKINL